MLAVDVSLFYGVRTVLALSDTVLHLSTLGQILNFRPVFAGMSEIAG